jgi:hypothetical protein
MEAAEGLTGFPQPNAERQISCGRFVTYSRASRKLTRSQEFLLDAPPLTPVNTDVHSFNERPC